jgi:lactoylglutathione lyase
MARAKFLFAGPYQDDKMNLPVANVAEAISWYENILHFKVLSQSDTPVRSVVLGRDEVQIGLAENGGDPTQDGCYFKVDDIIAAFREIKGIEPAEKDIEIQTYGGSDYKAFFAVAPDGLCYMFSSPV